MKKVKLMTLHANESVMKGEAKEISCTKHIIFAIALILLCNTGVKSQIQNLKEWTQTEMHKTVDWLYDGFKDFDRECFLAGTLGDHNGHYQTFTANKSSDEINNRVKWMFEKDLKFISDTMRRERITAFGWRDETLALFITVLFRNDYPDLRALHVCSLFPFVRHYGDEIKTVDGNRDPVCNNTANYEIELFSSSLAKTMAGYYDFDYDNILAVSSGGDIGYGGVINREKITTEAQKMSFLAGVFMRYEGYSINLDDSSKCSIRIPNSLSTTKVCIDILKEFGCDDIQEVQTEYKEEFITYNASDIIKDLLFLIYDLYEKTLGVVVAY